MFMTAIDTDINLAAAAFDYDIDHCSYDSQFDAFVVIHSNYDHLKYFISELFEDAENFAITNMCPN